MIRIALTFLLCVLAFLFGMYVMEEFLPYCEDSFNLKPNEVRACKLVGEE